MLRSEHQIAIGGQRLEELRRGSVDFWKRRHEVGNECRPAVVHRALDAGFPQSDTHHQRIGSPERPRHDALHHGAAIMTCIEFDRLVLHGLGPKAHGDVEVLVQHRARILELHAEADRLFGCGPAADSDEQPALRQLVEQVQVDSRTDDTRDRVVASPVLALWSTSGRAVVIASRVVMWVTPQELSKPCANRASCPSPASHQMIGRSYDLRQKLIGEQKTASQTGQLPPSPQNAHTHCSLRNAAPRGSARYTADIHRRCAPS